MSSFFPARGSADPWFRLGRLEVGTTVAVAATVVMSWIAWVVFGDGLGAALGYYPAILGSGQVWRVFTWPWANSLGLWPVVNLFFFWYFGSELEAAIGRVKMAWLLVGVWASLTAAVSLVGLAFDGGLFGISMIQFMVLLVWIAEYPTRRFFFAIPAWVFGVVLVALQIFVALGYRDFAPLLSLPLSLILVALVARRVGLLVAYPWIPGAPGRHRPRPAASRRPDREQQRRTSDRARLDELLDRINETGLHGLSEAEKRELKKLSERLRAR
jgi:hypothetical protein